MYVSRRLNFGLEVTLGAVAIVCIVAVLSAFRLDLYGGIIAAIFVVASLLFHEFAHFITALGCGVPVKAIGFSFKGAYLRRSDSGDPATEAAIAICGPVASLLLFALFRHAGPILEWVSQLNLVLALANLVPVAGTDGHRFLASLLRIARPHIASE